MQEKLLNRNFTLLILGQVSSLLGNLSLKFALSMYILEQTGSASLFAGLLAASMVPTILLSPFGGILADRADRRAVMVGLDSLSGLAVLLAALALPHGPDLAVIAALMIVLSVLAAFESPTVQACVPQMLAGQNVLRGNAMVSQVQAAASLVTPFLGSLFYTAFGLRPVFYGAVACFFLTALLECFLRLPRPAPAPRASLAAMVWQDFAVTLRFLRREQPAILGLLGLSALASMLIAGALVVGCWGFRPATTARLRAPWGWLPFWAGRSSPCWPGGCAPATLPPCSCWWGSACCPRARPLCCRWERWPATGSCWFCSAAASWGAASFPSTPPP